MTPPPLIRVCSFITDWDMFEIASYILYERPQFSYFHCELVNYILKEKVLSNLCFLQNLLRIREPKTKKYLLIK